MSSVYLYFLGHDEHKIQMSAGQMLLAGFNGLFTKLESEVDTLLCAVQLVDPTFENGVEVYKEIQELQVWTHVSTYAVYEMKWNENNMGIMVVMAVWCGFLLSILISFLYCLDGPQW